MALPQLEVLDGGLEVSLNRQLTQRSVPQLRSVAWTLWIRRNPQLPRSELTTLESRTQGSFILCGNREGPRCP